MLKKYYKKIVVFCYGFVYCSCKPVLTTAKLLTNIQSFLSREVLVPDFSSRESVRLRVIKLGCVPQFFEEASKRHRCF